MIINVLFVIAAMFAIGKMAQGYKRGMVKEIISFISLIVVCLIIALLANGLRNYLEQEMVNLVVTIILLAVIIVIHSFISVFFFTAKVISKLPVVSWVDKLMGIFVGALEAVLFIWVLYYFTLILDMGTVGTWVTDSAKENTILAWLYQNNYLVRLLEQVGVSNLAGLL